MCAYEAQQNGTSIITYLPTTDMTTTRITSNRHFPCNHSNTSFAHIAILIHVHKSVHGYRYTSSKFLLDARGINTKLGSVPTSSNRNIKAKA